MPYEADQISTTDPRHGASERRSLPQRSTYSNESRRRETISSPTALELQLRHEAAFRVRSGRSTHGARQEDTCDVGNKVERKRAVRRHERTMPSNVRTFDNPQSQLRIRVPSHEQIRRFLGVIRSISKPAGEQTMGTALGWYWKGTTGRASWALGRREEGEMIVRTTQVDATVCIRTWDRTAQKVGTSGGLPRNTRRGKENKTRRPKSLGGSSEHNRGDRAHHRF